MFNRRIYVLVLLVLVGTGSSVAADEAHASLRQFYPTGEFDLVIGEKKAEAQIFFSRRAAAYMIAPAGEKSMYVLFQRERKVARVPAQVIRRENGDVDLPKDVVQEVVGRFEVRKGDIVIEADPLRGRLTPRPPVLGRHSGSAVLAHSPQYGLIMRAYRVDKTALKRVQAAAEVKVEVLFGSWCPRCQQTIGHALGVERELGGAGIAFSYYGLPDPPAAWKDTRFLESQAKGLPTALVFVKDTLVGRIGPADWKQFEVSLAKVLQ